MNTNQPLDRDKSEPLYRQVVTYIKTRIADGTFSPQSALPSELELTAQLGVSRPTVRHALQILIEEALIERVRGRGTFVTGARIRSRRNRTGNLALICPTLQDTFTMRIIAGIESITADNGSQLILCNSGNQAAVEQKCLKDLWEGKKTDGVLLIAADAVRPHQTLLKYLSEGVPIVLIDRYFKGATAPFVVSDNHQGGYMLTKHLIDLGHREIGFIARPNLYVTSVAHLLQGYKTALAKAELTYHPAQIFQGLLPTVNKSQALTTPLPQLDDYDHNALTEFLSSPGRPSALLVSNDILAVQVIGVCQELGLHVPQDIAIVTYDDDTPATLLPPALTTVRQQTYEIGVQAAIMLLEILRGQQIETNLFLPVELVVRQSCGTG